MAVRTVDTLKPNNSTTATGKGTFPVAKADDVWFNDGDSLEEKVQNGTIGASIQVVAMPTANIENFGKIVQYIGITDTDYTNGHFYKCVTTDDGQGGLIYEWIHQNVDEISGNDTIQVEILPTASASEVGNIYQYIGATTTTLTNGYFYECIEDSGSYSWVEKEVQKNEDVPHWSGTRAEYEAIKDTLEAGTYIGITDDYDDGLEVVDEVEDGNMNPVTSNAVYDAISQIKTETKAKYKVLSFNSISGVTFAKRDNNPKALSATRVDNIIVLNYAITVQGTYTGESSWLPIFNASQLDSLLDDDEMLNDSVTPYFCSGITYTNNASYNKLDGIMNGYYLYFYNSAVFDMGIQGQIILGVQKTS